MIVSREREFILKKEKNISQNIVVYLRDMSGRPKGKVYMGGKSDRNVLPPGSINVDSKSN